MTGSVGLLRSMLPFFLAVAAFVREDVQPSAVQAASPKGEQQQSLPRELRELFARLDSLGRDKVKDARFVELAPFERRGTVEAADREGVGHFGIGRSGIRS